MIKWLLALNLFFALTNTSFAQSKFITTAGGDISGGGGDISGGGDGFSGGPNKFVGENGQTDYESFNRYLVGADHLAEMKLDGAGYSVVVVDTGIAPGFRGMELVVEFIDYTGECTRNRKCDGNSPIESSHRRVRCICLCYVRSLPAL